MDWYAIQTYSGSEQSVKKAIENLANDHNIRDRIQEIIVPTEDIIEVSKKSKTKVTERSLYPGYVFIKVDLDTVLWHKIQS
ncbi:transcription termination/antitermination protein NusG, partial [Helicobacter pylori]|nr:transcription termination/antitermination protein NusG [Helicobacter pylori]